MTDPEGGAAGSAPSVVPAGERADTAEGPTVSVIIPAYDAGFTIAQAVRSALRQTRPPHEVIVVDDASHDDTVAVVSAIAAEEPTVRLLRMERNSGVSAARSRAIAVATGDWIALLDADDVWLETKLERQMAFAAARPELDLISGYYQELFGDRPGGVRSEFWWQSACIVHRRVFDEVAFDPAWTVSELPEFLSRFDRLFRRDGVREVVMQYRMNLTGLAHRRFLVERMAWLLIEENRQRREAGHDPVPFTELLAWYRRTVPSGRRLQDAIRWRGDWSLRRALIEASSRHLLPALGFGALGSLLSPRSVLTKLGRARSITPTAGA